MGRIVNIKICVHAQKIEQREFSMNKRTFERLKKKVALWLLNDVQDAWAHQSFYNEPLAFFSSLETSNPHGVTALIGLNFEYLRHWHLVRYENSSINLGSIDCGHLALAAKYAKKSLEVNQALIIHGLDKEIDCSILLTNAALTLAIPIIAGWEEDAKSILKSLISGLDNSLLDLRKNPHNCPGELYRHLWFLLHLCSDMFAVALVTDDYSYPEDMSPYDEVLKHWKTNDLELVQSLVSSMADYHLRHAREGRHGDIYEFDKKTQALFPYEILGFLRIREWAGLKNPETFDHLLMNTPLAHMPAEPIPYPAPDFSDQVVENLIKYGMRANNSMSAPGY